VSTFHASAIEAVTRRISEENTEYAGWLKIYFARLNAGFYGAAHVAKFVQRFRGQQAFTMEEAYAFMQCHGLLLSGDVLAAEVVVGFPPVADCETDAHNRALAGLPGPFYGKFWGGKDDEDGYIAWDEPVWLQKTVGHADGSQDATLVEIPPGRVPLEIGTTLGSRSLAHLQGDRGLARWPYGSDSLWVFWNTKTS